jgi:tetratricopeptide (TPR) repeat protein
VHSFSLKQRFCNLTLSFCIFTFFLSSDSIYAESFTSEEGKRLIQEEEFERAKEVLLKVVEKEPDNAEVNFLLCKVSVILDDHDDGIKYGNKAIDLDESVSDYHLWLGRAHGLQAQKGSQLKAIFRAKRAKKEWEKAVSLDSTNVTARLQLAQYLLMAPGIAGGDKKKAKKQAEIIQDIDSLYGAIAWGYYWQFQKDTVKTEKYFREAVRLDTTRHHNASYFLGFFLQERERYHEAAEFFEDELEKYPEERGLLYQVGRSYVLSEDSLDKAERCFKQYLQTEPKKNQPGWAAAHWRLGMVYDLKGEKDLAIVELEEAVRLDPENKEFKKTLEEVKKKK